MYTPENPTNFAKYIGPNHNLSPADCMSFSYKYKMLRSGNSYDLRTQPELSAQEKEAARELETDTIEGDEENSIRFSSDLVDERIKASLETLHAEISALIEMMDRLIQCNSATNTTTVSSRKTRHQYELLYSRVPGSSRFPTVAPLITGGYWPDIR